MLKPRDDAPRRGLDDRRLTCAGGGVEAELFTWHGATMVAWSDVGSSCRVEHRGPPASSRPNTLDPDVNAHVDRQWPNPPSSVCVDLRTVRAGRHQRFPDYVGRWSKLTQRRPKGARKPTAACNYRRCLMQAFAGSGSLRVRVRDLSDALRRAKAG